MDKKEIEKDVKTYSSLVILKESEGGKILIDTLKESIVNSVDNLCANYKTLSQTEFISICAGMNERMSILRVLKNSTDNKKLAKEALDEALAEDKEKNV